MLRKPLLSIAAVSASLLALTACSTNSSNSSSDSSPSPSNSTQTQTPSPSPGLEFPPPPADSVLTLTGAATADNGATLKLMIVVHASVPADTATAASQAMANWCSGEVDASVLSAQKAAFTQIDYSAELLGSTPWPADLPIALTPYGQPNSLVTTGDVKQLEVFNQQPSQGDYIPHCLQGPYLLGAGTGTSYLAIPGDADGSDGFPALQAWSHLIYGFNAAVPAGFLNGAAFGGADPSRVSFTDCGSAVTPKGASLGAPMDGLPENFTATSCSVGG